MPQAEARHHPLSGIDGFVLTGTRSYKSESRRSFRLPTGKERHSASYAYMQRLIEEAS
ncbi:hypothetical protein GCM10010136_01790 [Limoniibacter endophyticus]|uniref:Uncharacterized protein n=1 Tax=Limoniibacter endophyticus TaxID=1565040 RepID=A0A8J3DLE1_9HYPH|nr:hypothetical protein GCM10010136_01790 [Limoniibacter endophyticus]